MDATTITWAGIISLIISTIATIIVHKILAKDLSKVLSDLQFIKHQYETALAKNTYDLENRRKTELIAELFVFWQQTGNPAKTGMPNKMYREFGPDDWMKLHKLSYEAALWLPKNIFEDLSKRLRNDPGAKDIKEILIDVRNHLDPDLGTVNWKDVIHFS
jgi:hypothetical protein